MGMQRQQKQGCHAKWMNRAGECYSCFHMMGKIGGRYCPIQSTEAECLNHSTSSAVMICLTDHKHEAIHKLDSFFTGMTFC